MSMIDLDTLQLLAELSLLNPLVTVPVFVGLCALRGSLLGIIEAPSLLLALSLTYQFNIWLNDKAQNNWVDDEYNWNRELVVVTGGSQGIGAAVIRELSERKIKVINIDIVQPSSTTLESSQIFYHCDLSSPLKIRTTISAIQREHGNPTVLFNNAGTWNKTPLLRTSDEETSRLFQINTLAHYQLIKAFMPAMVAKNHGMIVTMSSVIAYGTAPPAMVDYAATKAANMSLHESIGSELAVVYQAPKVRTVLVMPNFTKTTLTAGLNPESLIFRDLEPEELAKHIVRQVLSGRSGQVLLPKCVGWTEAYVRTLPVWMQKIRAINPTIIRS